MIVFYYYNILRRNWNSRTMEKANFFPADIDLTGIICNNSIIHRKRNPEKDRSNKERAAARKRQQCWETRFMKVLEIIGSAVSDAVEYVVEKNKIQAQQNRLRMVMRNEADLINRSYIALGKYYYENLRGKDDSEQNRTCCETIDKSSARMQKAADRYRSLIEAQAKVSYDEYAALEDDGEDITVCCSYEDLGQDAPVQEEKGTEATE